ncbi:glycerophosphodiester phosphodiesterase family protein [Lentilactobacillus senioris]|uniref:glycerophosphodiester phosphodiesterase family protein n=1 Tax=Lentilactobacillus senioris TaxID=931534 RepID=UPI002281CBA8|nr:glycerophosphodiester phosphodiesterase family protein [Lentilactobacillus senioris]MCY9807285.1 glycerophosphodiester phosphodiesterase family protein [Lentilactobacillus senioris]
MQVKISLNKTELMLLALVATLGQWLNGLKCTWNFLILGIFGIIIIWLAFIGQRMLAKFEKDKWGVISLGIMALLPFNFLGLLAEVLTYVPISGSVILFLNNHFKLVISLGIILTIIIWLILAVMLARFWHTTIQLQIRQLIKNIGLYLGWLVGLTGILLLTAEIFKTQWITAVLNGGLILGLSVGQLWLLIHVWAGGNLIQYDDNSWVSLIIGATAVGLGFNLTNMMHSFPQEIIAHRGVYQKNELPNTISALTQTSQQKFDFVEMDVRETKDHQFICQHDDEFHWGVNHADQVENLTLKQIKQHSKVDLFKDYISVANQKHQRLLVEIKPGNVNSRFAGRDFIHQFKTQMKQNNGMVHSMELSYLQQIKQITDEVPVGLVLTINTGNVMNKPVDFYSVQAFTLNPAFVQQANQHKRPIYVWTVRRSIQSLILKTIPITGQITDIGKTVRYLRFPHSLGQEMFLVATAWNYL